MDVFEKLNIIEKFEREACKLKNKIILKQKHDLNDIQLANYTKKSDFKEYSKKSIENDNQLKLFDEQVFELRLSLIEQDITQEKIDGELHRFFMEWIKKY